MMAAGLCVVTVSQHTPLTVQKRWKIGPGENDPRDDAIYA
jgi:hypothetical protein